MLYLHDVYSNQYPFWVRLIYGVENSFIGPYIIDAVAPKVTQELSKNPYLMSVLKKQLPSNFNWDDLGIDPDYYGNQWTHLCNTVFKEIVR